MNLELQFGSQNIPLVNTHVFRITLNWKNQQSCLDPKQKVKKKRKGLRVVQEEENKKSGMEEYQTEIGMGSCYQRLAPTQETNMGLTSSSSWDLYMDASMCTAFTLILPPKIKYKFNFHFKGDEHKFTNM